MDSVIGGKWNSFKLFKLKKLEILKDRKQLNIYLSKYYQLVVGDTNHVEFDHLRYKSMDKFWIQINVIFVTYHLCNLLDTV